MPLPKSLTQVLRQGQVTAGNGWRAYFAPFNQQAAVQQTSTSIGPTIYDLGVLSKFIDGTNGPPTGWFDLGFTKAFKFTPGSKTGNIMAGYRGAIRAKYRAETSEKMSCTFGEVSHTTIRIATGTQVFNLLKSTAAASVLGPLSSSGIAAIPMGAGGYSASGAIAGYAGLPTLAVTTGSGAYFSAGDYIVCDQDYNNTTYGFVGDAGANVFQGAVNDVDFIRKTSDYVQGVRAVSGDNLILNGPFVGGGNAPYGTVPNYYPTTGAKIQKISGYASREGGTYITEWSAIFTLDTINAAQYLFYYPRVAPDTFAGLTATALQGATSMSTFDLEANFDALAFDDPVDGETVVRYSAYFPPPNTSAGI